MQTPPTDRVGPSRRALRALLWVFVIVVCLLVAQAVVFVASPWVRRGVPRSRADGYIRAGDARMKRGDTNSAMECYRKAIRVEPSNDVAYVRLADICFSRGRLSEAMLYYREALSAKPENVEARCGLGRCLIAYGRTNEAIAEYREAIRLKPGCAKAHEGLALALAKSGRLSEAGREVALCRKFGLKPPPDLQEALEAAHPRPLKPRTSP